jgi:CRISPR system Cascade subunit CasB
MSWRRSAVKLTAKALRTLRAAVLQLHYRVQLRLPLRNRAVFAAYWGRGHSCNPGALETAFRTHAPHIRTAWIARPEHHHTIPAATRRLRPNTAAYWTALARSKYLVNNVNFDRRLVKRPGQVMIQTQHGTPLKHMGLDLQERPAAARDMDFGELLKGVDKWDHVLSPNRHTTLTWERVYPGSYTTLAYGYPRNDVFQQATSADVARLRESLGIPQDTIALLYAPTHRDYRRVQRAHIDLDRVLRRLGPRFVVLARAHYWHEGPLTAHTSGRVIDVTDHPSVESLCLASDALVTDYSSLMFDYANLDRPIVIHADDWEAYEAARGTYFDLRAFPPGAVARSEDELIDIFATDHWRGSRSTQLRTAFRERFCPYDDGRAAERVVRHVVLGETDLPPVVPLAERHPVPSAAASLTRSPLTTVPQPTTSLPVTDRL